VGTNGNVIVLADGSCVDSVCVRDR